MLMPALCGAAVFQSHLKERAEPFRELAMERPIFLLERRIESALWRLRERSGCTVISKGNSLSVIVNASNVLIGVQILK
jgi:hypothetical protein